MNKYLIKYLLVLALFMCKHSAFSQNECRVGLNLAEVYGNHIWGGHPISDQTSILLFRGIQIEKQRGKLNHRISFRSLDLHEDLNKPFRYYDGLEGQWEYKGFDIGYDLLYQLRKFEKFKVGIGLYYSWGRETGNLCSGWGYCGKYNYLTQGIGTNVTVEANFKIGGGFYVSPSASILFSYLHHKGEGFESGTKFTMNETPIRLTLKKIIKTAVNKV